MQVKPTHVLSCGRYDLDMIFFSHLHLDHVGGMAEQKTHTFSLSRGPVSLPDIPIYSPAPVTGSKWNPSADARVISDPVELKPGIFNIGTLSHQTRQP